MSARTRVPADEAARERFASARRNYERLKKKLAPFHKRRRVNVCSTDGHWCPTSRCLTGEL